MLRKMFLITSWIIGFHAFANEPPTRISGKISDGEVALPFATISIIGTTLGTVSDNFGHFELLGIPSGKLVLRIQNVGYKTTEIPVITINGGHTKVNVNLEADYIGLNEIVVTANRYEANRQETPVIVNVISNKLLQTGNAVCLSDGLSYTSGLRVENNCQNCGFQQVRINGLEGPYSQILIDSKPILSALGGVYGIEQIPVSMIERVEVVRGGGSALYGSNAIAGTINIITREPVKNTLEGNLNYSMIGGKAADRTISFNGTYVSDDRKSGLHFFAVNRDRNHFDANNDGFSEIGLIQGNAFGFRSFIKTSNFGKITATYHYMDEFRRGGNLFELQPHETDITEQTDHKINGGEIVYDIYSKNLKSKVSIYSSAQHIVRESYYGAQQDPNAYGHTTDITVVGGFQWNHSSEKALFGAANFIAGAEIQSNKLHDKMPGYQRDLQQNIEIGGVFGQSEWKWQKGSVLVGIRADKHSLIKKMILSPRATFLFNLNAKMQWRTSVSTGFRAPQAFDEDLHILAVNGGVMLIQLAENLRPEYSRSFSSSLDMYPKVLGKESNIMVEAFYTYLDDVFVLETLETDADGNKIVERRNGSGAKVLGLNIENKTVINKNNQLQVGLTLQRSTYVEPETWSENPYIESIKNLPKSPNAYGYLHWSSSFKNRWKSTLSGIYTGSMKVMHFEGYITQDDLVTTKPFFELNLKIGYTFTIAEGMNLQVDTGVQNLFNSYQNDFDKGTFRDAGFMYGPMKPRTYFISLKIGNLI